MINEALWIVNWKLKQVMWLLGNQDMISVFFFITIGGEKV